MSRRSLYFSVSGIPQRVLMVHILPVIYRCGGTYIHPKWVRFNVPDHTTALDRYNMEIALETLAWMAIDLDPAWKDHMINKPVVMFGFVDTWEKFNEHAKRVDHLFHEVRHREHDIQDLGLQ